MLGKTVTALILIVFLSETFGTEKYGADKYFDLCYRSDSKIDKCIEQAMNKAIKDLVQGYPDIRVPPLDPFQIPNMKIGQNDGNNKLYSVFSNAVIKGFGKISIEKMRTSLSDLSNMRFKFLMRIPRVEMHSDLQVHGKILGLPIHGNGRVYINATGVSDVMKMKAYTVVKARDRKQYMEVAQVSSDLSFKAASARMENITVDNKILPADVNKFVSANIFNIFEAFKKPIDEAFESVIKAYANRVMKTFPVDEIFLP